MTRFQPYKPAAYRRQELAMEQLAEAKYGPPPPKKEREHPEWDWLEYKVRMGSYEHSLPYECICAGKFEGCGMVPVKLRLILTATELNNLVLQDRADPRLFIPLCDRCFLLKLARVDELKSKTRWINETANAIRMATTNVRAHYEQWSDILIRQLEPYRVRAQEIVDASRARCTEVTITKFEPMPEIPAGIPIYFDFTRVRDGIVRIVIQST